MRHYYAADNYYGSETSVGFANTWYVLAFRSKKERDDYVSASHNLSARAIKSSEVKKYQSYQAS